MAENTGPILTSGSPPRVAIHWLLKKGHTDPSRGPLEYIADPWEYDIHLEDLWGLCAIFSFVNVSVLQRHGFLLNGVFLFFFSFVFALLHVPQESVHPHAIFDNPFPLFQKFWIFI